MKFPDVDYSRWYGDCIDKASEAGVMIGDDRGNFRPDEPLTRGEAAAIVARLLEGGKRYDR